MKKLLCTLFVILLCVSQANAQTSIFNAADRSSTTTEMRFPVDISSSSSPGHIKIIPDNLNGIYFNSGGQVFASPLLFSSAGVLFLSGAAQYCDEAGINCTDMADVLLDSDIGVGVQAFDDNLLDIAALGVISDNEIMVGIGAGTYGFESGATLRTSIGAGDVIGPSSATDNAITRFDLTTGKIIQNSSVFVDDSGQLGVGTASPSSLLHVTDGLKTSAGEQVRFNIGTDEANTFELAVRIIGNATAGDRYVDVQSIEQGVSARDLVFQDGGGNIGISTNSGLAKLSINGGLNVGGDTDPGDNNLSVVGFISAGSSPAQTGNFRLPQGGTLEARNGADSADIIFMDSAVVNTRNAFRIANTGGVDVVLQNTAAARIGFFAATPAVKPTITGTRADTAALADLLTELATLGLITDSSTAGSIGTDGQIIFNSSGSLISESDLKYDEDSNTLTLTGPVIDTADMPAARTADHIFALSDLGAYIRYSSTGSLSATVPPNSSVAFPIGQMLFGEVFDGINTLTLVAGSGVTLNTNTSLIFTSAGFGLVKTSTDIWTAIGGD